MPRHWHFSWALLAGLGGWAVPFGRLWGVGMNTSEQDFLPRCRPSHSCFLTLSFLLDPIGTTHLPSFPLSSCARFNLTITSHNTSRAAPALSISQQPFSVAHERDIQ